ncbi:hypothetical protein AALO_G00035500 [Alosa alosa]|uniref:Uncharacterized protein n=1 Tax=Alosa alosa TaxID=278164 RepID=A0AAV6H8C6_9TELE|nr:hypothetical protein AALO_G00035500 [Alosa alosa]
MPVFKKGTDDEGDQPEEPCSSEASEKRENSEEVLPQSVNSNRYKNAKKHYRETLLKYFGAHLYQAT